MMDGLQQILKLYVDNWAIPHWVYTPIKLPAYDCNSLINP